jgi:hypothetical protein
MVGLCWLYSHYYACAYWAKASCNMSAQKELIIYRKMLRTARRALQSIRDYEPWAHMIARNALDEIEQTSFGVVPEVDEEV